MNIKKKKSPESSEHEKVSIETGKLFLMRQIKQRSAITVPDPTINNNIGYIHYPICKV